MKTENIKLIAEFMGYEIINYRGQPTYNGNRNYKTIEESITLWGGLYLEFTGRYVKDVLYPFNEDWNYLMPVIRQIEESGYVVSISGISCKIYPKLEENNILISLVCGDTKKKLELVYDAVINFLQIYTFRK